MTAAIEALHTQYPGRYKTSAETSFMAAFEHNPYITPKVEGARDVYLNYPLINQADHRHCHFMQGMIEDLAKTLDIHLDVNVKRPHLYLSEEEKSWIPQVEGRFWLVNAGYKSDFTIKKWRHDYWQEVIDKLLGVVHFVQVGESHHNHRPLSNVTNLIGKTDGRQLIRLAYHAEGMLTPESLLHHLAAAFSKPCVTLMSGFLPRTWVQYHTGTILTHQEKMPCCKEGKGCWKAKVEGACLLPMIDDDSIATCMDWIRPDDVVREVKAYTRLTYGTIQ